MNLDIFLLCQHQASAPPEELTSSGPTLVEDQIGESALTDRGTLPDPADE